MTKSAMIRQIRRPWQVSIKDFRPIQIITVGDFCQKVIQIFVDLKLIGSSGFYQRVENGGGGGESAKARNDDQSQKA